MSGAVVVTTPHALSHVDVLKGVAMYEQLKVPTLAVVENLAYLDVETTSQANGKILATNDFKGAPVWRAGEAPARAATQSAA